MTEANPKETTHSHQTLRDNILFIVWGGVLYLCTLVLKSDNLSGNPPLWDNLAYQLESLRLLTNWIDGDLEKTLQGFYQGNSPAYILAIASSFRLFGFNAFSPYLVSAFFGIGCMIAIYLLCQELGIGKRGAFWGVIFFSLLPSFIYQNFLQTRNDFPLAFFITLSWVLFLKGIKGKNIKLAFFSGVIAGIGTLFKASAPGYIAWGVLAFLFFPEIYIQTNFKNRTKLVLFFVAGAVLSCGWHFLPHLGQILSYYINWGNAKTWVITQYDLQANWTDYFFYLRNIIFFHLGEKIFIGITIVSGALLLRWFLKRQIPKHTENNFKECPLIILVILAGVIPLVFVSLRQSFSSLGDIPVIPLLVAGSLAFLYRISCGIAIPRFFLVPLLPICLIVSIYNLPIIEKPFSAKSIEKLSKAALEIRKNFGLSNTPMMQVFSHPIYNVDSLSWLWLMNPKIDKSFVHEPSKIREIMFPENSKTIASKLKTFPLLILSEFSGTVIQGEKFATMNRLHSKINAHIYKQGHFIKLRSLDLEGGSFPIHFMLNKNFSILRSSHTKNDNSIKWGEKVDFFSLKQTKLFWRAVPTNKINSFKLVDKNNKASFIKMTLNKILPNGKYEYQSKMVSATDKLITFIVMPESSELLSPISKMDQLMLAFNKVETEIIKYD